MAAADDLFGLQNLSGDPRRNQSVRTVKSAVSTGRRKRATAFEVERFDRLVERRTRLCLKLRGKRTQQQNAYDDTEIRHNFDPQKQSAIGKDQTPTNGGRSRYEKAGGASGTWHPPVQGLYAAIIRLIASRFQPNRGNFSTV